MRRGITVLTVLTVMLVLLAFAAPATAKGKPQRPPSDTGYACADLVANGAVWDLGEHAAGVYTGTISNDPQHGGVCIDLLDQHRVEGNWTVEWTISVPEGELRGLLLIFEKGRTGKVYDDNEVLRPGNNSTGTWTTDSFTPDGDGPFVFVAMRDLKGAKKSNWSIDFSITPLATG